MASPKLVLLTEELAVAYTGRPASTIRRWALEGRLTRYEDPKRRKNGVLYDFLELQPKSVDEDTGMVTPGAAPPLPVRQALAA